MCTLLNESVKHNVVKDVQPTTHFCPIEDSGWVCVSKVKVCNKYSTVNHIKCCSLATHNKHTAVTAATSKLLRLSVLNNLLTLLNLYTNLHQYDHSALPTDIYCINLELIL